MDRRGTQWAMKDSNSKSVQTETLKTLKESMEEQQEPRRSKRQVASNVPSAALKQLKQRMGAKKQQEDDDGMDIDKKRRRIDEMADEIDGMNDDELYDVVDEDTYRNIVAKRREDGDFVVDDGHEDGDGYIDDGEEPYWDERHGDEFESDEESKNKNNKKGKKWKSNGNSKHQKNKKIGTEHEKEEDQEDLEEKEDEVKDLPPKNHHIGKMFAKISASAVLTGGPKMSHAPKQMMENKHNEADISDLLKSLTGSSIPRTQISRRSTMRIVQSQSMSSRRRPTTISQIPSTSMRNDDFEQDDPMHSHDDYENNDDVKSKIPNDEQQHFDAEPESTTYVPKVNPTASKVQPSDVEDLEISKPTISASSKTKLFSEFQSKPVQQHQDITSNQEQYKAELNVHIDTETNDQFIDVFWLDMYEDKLNAPGTVFLFGKTRSSAVGNTKENQFGSILVVVKNIQRTMYILPRSKSRKDGEDVTDDTVKAEVTELVRGIRSTSATGPVMKAKFVELNYAFEVTGVPREMSRYLMVQYPMSNEDRGQFIPQDISGDTYSHIFGSNQSAIEQLILSLQLMGPCWIRIKKPDIIEESMRLSWCKFEIECNDPIKNITKVDGPPPSLKVLSVSLKTMVNQSSHQHEIIAISMVDQEFSGFGTGEIQGEKPSVSTIVRPPHAGISINSSLIKSNSEELKCTVLGGERALLFSLCAKMHLADADILMGHGFLSFQLDLLLTRMKQHKITQWSKLGRLKRNVMPKHGRVAGGRETHYGVLTPGRLVLDTYQTARELLIGHNDYTLSSLCENLKITTRKISPKGDIVPYRREDIDPNRVPSYFEGDGKKVLELLHHNLDTAKFTLQLALRLEALPLTLELTKLGGNLWRRTLEGGRAERIEYLLLHSFKNKGFVIPDKYDPHFSMAAKSIASSLSNTKKLSSKGKGGGGGNSTTTVKRKVGRQKPAYAGGLVLDPQPGLYQDYVLLLDFNSLYPSIIQEYNICFTTVKRPSGLGPGNARNRDGTLLPTENASDDLKDKEVNQDEEEVQENGNQQIEGEDNNVNAEIEMGAAPVDEDEATMLAAIEPPTEEFRKEEAILPAVIRNLVERRRAVKAELKKETNAARKKQLDVRQKALKITANSMYGCLGFTASRFYAKPIASLVTRLGREILMNTINIVKTLNHTVLYGDTDSLFVQSGEKSDIDKAREIAKEIISNVNKQYRKLELDMDGIMKTLLLCKKKKYAALMVTGEEEDPLTKIKKVKTEKETKGLDLVRRDWCPLSRTIGHHVLDEILSGKDTDDVLGSIRKLLETLAKDVRNGDVKLENFVITKGLNKSPQDYPDVKGQPHLQVAMAMLKRGTVVNIGDHIPYVICQQTRTENSENSSVKNPNIVETPSVATPPTNDENSAVTTTTPAATSSDSTTTKKKTSSGKASFAERAFHPEEVRDSGGKLQLDYEWYLGTQILPPIQRLCEPIGGISHAELAELLGLDSSKYRQSSSNHSSGTFGNQETVDISDEEKFKGCEKIELTCDACNCVYEFPGVYWTPEAKIKYKDPSVLDQTTNGKAAKRQKKNDTDELSLTTSSGLECPRCSSRFEPTFLQNILQIHARRFIEKYQNRWLVPDDLSVDLRIRQQSVRGQFHIHNGRKYQMQLEYTSKTLYTQLLYLQCLVDVQRSKKNLDKENELRLNVKKPIVHLHRFSNTDEDAFKTIEKHFKELMEVSAYTRINPKIFFDVKIV